jgi:outer membrane immunogenic protein
MRTFALGCSIATLIACGSAVAADIPAGPVYKAYVPPTTTWTGFFIGVHGGAGLGNKSWDSTELLPNVGFPFLLSRQPGLVDATYTTSGALAGLQAGFNYQSGSFVWGMEVDGSWSGIKGRSAFQNFTLSPIQTEIRSVGTLSGRIGRTVDHVLLYVKGGGAWATERHDLACFSCGGIATPPFGLPFSESWGASQTRWGWMFGAGAEYAFDANWSAKIEYDYLDFGTRTTQFNVTSPIPPLCAGCTFFAAPVPFTERIRQSLHVIKFGVNYRFNWAGSVAANY